MGVHRVCEPYLAPCGAGRGDHALRLTRLPCILRARRTRKLMERTVPTGFTDFTDVTARIPRRAMPTKRCFTAAPGKD